MERADGVSGLGTWHRSPSKSSIPQCRGGDKYLTDTWLYVCVQFFPPSPNLGNWQDVSSTIANPAQRLWPLGGGGKQCFKETNISTLPIGGSWTY